MNVKRQGSNWERTVIKRIAQALGLNAFNSKNHNEAQIGSTRQFNTNDDAKGIDVWWKGNYPVDIQCKSTTVTTKHISLPVAPLERLGEKGVVLWQVLRKVNTKRKTEGCYVVMREDLFYKLLKTYYDELLRESGNQSELP